MKNQEMRHLRDDIHSGCEDRAPVSNSTWLDCSLGVKCSLFELQQHCAISSCAFYEETELREFWILFNKFLSLFDRIEQ